MAANDVPCCESMFWVYLLICVALVAFAGLMSGLTLGLMSLSLVDLEILVKAGQPQDRKNAEKILPIVKNQHRLLCTLLICNSLAMEALPIFVDALLPAWGAILISVTLILAFGEIIPQAVCSKYGLSVGAKLSPLVRLLVIVVFPLSYPISKLLDLLLGKGHSALLRRAELKTLVDMHGHEAGKGGELTHEETTIISGALDLTQKTAKDAMTPISEIFSLDLNSVLDDDTMNLILRKGHSRVPVHSESTSNIIGLILVKNLIKCRFEDETPIRNLTIRRIPRVLDSVPLYEILCQFQKGQSHMAVVVKSKHNTKDFAEISIAKNDRFKTNIDSTSWIQKRADENGIQNNSRYASSITPNDIETQSPTTSASKVWETLHSNQEEEVIGIITMEDVLEELLQEEILDETDGYVDVHKKIRINMLPPMKSFSRSPKTPPEMPWRTPLASPLSSSHQTPVSSYHHTPTLRSPDSPYIQSPFIRPTLSASPEKPIPSSSPGTTGSPFRTSPSSHKVSGKSYEKLGKHTVS
ncbi:DUF21 domain-containing protein At5g52790-like isoform X4 [Diospyros lotus]|uniref:DUF21 domain-containing protein At5g52790-like isoform X4 n=1 Tax=Diospyros lotus TaxID=55363 RepID=UPI002255725B|nr:DUF21 domain-containing protein At5g52790-like isoform X4 [Diospyros lotus]XP_052186784.1 DUF21 domain-containing protein At5g52790-like isoform X4 [Diospyros lotus]XP_052186785.1 DUF21 domain-containing protein At5g52790-like isoform X4 [Diospyros lotus]